MGATPPREATRLQRLVTFAWIDNASVQFPLNIYAMSNGYIDEAVEKEKGRTTCPAFSHTRTREQNALQQAKNSPIHFPCQSPVLVTDYRLRPCSPDRARPAAWPLDRAVLRGRSGKRAVG